MPTGGKSSDQCYNAQVAVDAENQIIVSASVVQAPNDNGQLLPVLNRVWSARAAFVPGVVADAGYKNERDLAQLAAMNIDAFIATGREGKNASSANAKDLRRFVSTTRRPPGGSWGSRACAAARFPTVEQRCMRLAGLDHAADLHLRRR